jgi:hypothetical protein
LKRNDGKINKWIKSNYKGITIVVVMVVASILINAYIGFGPTSPPLPISNNKPTSNTKVDPFVMRGAFYLNITINNRPFIIPSQIGIEEPLWHNHTLDKYGSVARTSNQGMTMAGMAPLYTNDNSGLVKIGSTIIRNYTLEDFFNIWGFNFNFKDKIVNATINGNPISDFEKHILKDNDQIYLQINNRQ